jgi:hypothetical protein
MRTLLLALLLVPAQARAPVPDAAAIKDAEKQVRGIFKDEYAKKTVADVNALARRLLAQTTDASLEPGVRYVMFRDARDFGLQTGDVDTALKAVDGMGAAFEVDRIAAKIAMLTKLVPTAKTPDTALPVALGHAQVMEDCIAGGQFDAGAALAPRAEAIAKVAADSAVQGRIAAAGKELAYLQKEAAAVKGARKTLDEKPTDPAANAAVGRFLCVSQGQWEKGLLMVVLGNEAAFKAAAETELAGPADAKAQLALADQWWIFADKERAPEGRKRIQAHAATWYAKVLPELNGLAAAGVEAKLRQTSLVVLHPGHQQKKSELVGGSGGGGFEDLGAGPSPMIGIKASFLGSPSIMKSVQGIFLTNGARVDGKIFGELLPPVKEVVAKPGYAVGGLITTGGESPARGRAFKVVFMRIAGTGLDAADKYESPWLGDKTAGAELKLGGDGSYVIGVCGRCAADIDAFGIISFGR